MQADHHSPAHVLAVPGSLRRGSWNKRLLQAAIASAPDSVHLSMFEDLGSLPLFDEDLEVDDPEPVRSFRSRVVKADGILVATPEYNQSVPGVLKNAIDWLSRPYGESCLIGKPVAVIGSTPGSWGTRIAQKELRHILWATGALVLPDPPLYVRSVASLFGERDRLVDEETRRALARLLAVFADFIRWTGRRNEGSLF